MLSVSLLLPCIYLMCTCILMYNRDVCFREEMFLVIKLAIFWKKFYMFWKINPDLKFPFITIPYQILLTQHMFDLFNWLNYLLNKILSLVQNLANTTLLISSIFDQTSKYWMYDSFTIVPSFPLKSSLKYISMLFKKTNTIYKRIQE